MWLQLLRLMHWLIRLYTILPWVNRFRLYLMAQDVCFGIELGSTSLTLFVSDEGHSGRLRLSPFYSLAHREDVH